VQAVRMELNVKELKIKWLNIEMVKRKNQGRTD